MLLPKCWLRFLVVCIFLILSACEQSSWNNPYPPTDANKNILYTAFSNRPKHLDPVRSYVSNEYELIAQIYEPPVQYHYLKRPYTLVPLSTTEVPQPVLIGKNGDTLPGDTSSDKVAFSIYEIRIKPGIYYQPHPAFARDSEGHFLYHNLTEAQLDKIDVPGDFEQTGTRELVAADYVNQIKRLAHPKLNSPIYGVMVNYIVGLKEFAETLKQANDKLAATKTDNAATYLDLTQFPLEGAEVVDRYTYRIKINGKYPQFIYWLAMPFFAPMPPEAEQFYAQQGLIDKNITLDWYPVGTGPYMLTVNDPNYQMVLERNPDFHGEAYPVEGDPGDQEKGLLNDADKPMPFIDKVVFNLEKESIPYWNKFLQGYYDTSSVSSDTFDQAIQITSQGDATLSEEMQDKGIKLITAVQTSTFYVGFNMLDPLIGGNKESTRKLRQAISIAVDYEEFISIFLNGRGIPGQGPVPPGIFGAETGERAINPYVYDVVNGKAQRKSIEEAKRLLAEAGYPNGRNASTGKPLLLHFDTGMGGPSSKALFDWLRKQFDKINIKLVIRSTDFNRFMDKLAKGTAQIFWLGWNADYPDPENFMFLLDGPNRRAGKNGENSANYDNPEFNALFEKMKTMDNTPERLKIIQDMTDIVRRDAPWLWGYHPKGFSLHHSWYYNAKPNLMANNTLKYKRLDPEIRAVKRKEWNQPVLKPLYIILAVLLLGLLPGIITYLRKEHNPITNQKKQSDDS